MAAPKITDAKIKGWVGTTYAQRGRDYYHRGQVVRVKWKGDSLTGQVQGSEPRPYRVTVLFDGAHIDSQCSCPIGGDCKHVAALLYAAMHDRPPKKKKGPTLEAQLRRLEKPALLELIGALLDEAPELEEVVNARLLALSAATLEPDEVRERVLRLVRQVAQASEDEYGYGDYKTADAALSTLEVLVAQAQTFAEQRQWSGAHHLLHALLSECMLLEPYVLEDDALYRTLSQAVATMLKCWRALPAESELRASALRLLFDVLAWDLHLGGSDFYSQIEGDLLRHALPDERDRLREWSALASRQASQRTSGRGANGFTREWMQGEWQKFVKRLAASDRGKKRPTAAARPSRR